VKDNQGQLIITAGQMVWTAECEKALSDAEGAKKALRLLKRKWVSYLSKLTAVTRSKLNKVERNKVRHGTPPNPGHKYSRVHACNLPQCDVASVVGMD